MQGSIGVASQGAQGTNTGPEVANTPATDGDFAFLLVAFAIYMVSVQLFNLTTKIVTWFFAGVEKSPPADQGWLACTLTTAAIFIACWLRTSGEVDAASVIRSVLTEPKLFGLGFLAMSLVPSSIALSKIVGLLSVSRNTDAGRPNQVGFAIGAAILGAVNFAASIVTIATSITRNR